MFSEVCNGGDRESCVLNKDGMSFDQMFEYFLGKIPVGKKQQRINQVHHAPESPRRKRKTTATQENQETLTVEDVVEAFTTLTELETTELYDRAKTELAENIKERSYDWAFDVILPLLERGDIELNLAKVLVEEAHKNFAKESALINLDFEEGIDTVVVGDIHGQFRDLLLIFRKFGRPGVVKRYIFNGDIVDRGPRSVACWLFICALKISCPQCLFVTRGNHESRTVSRLTSSFASECANNYSEEFFMQCQRTFDELPLAYVLNKTVFVI